MKNMPDHLLSGQATTTLLCQEFTVPLIDKSTFSNNFHKIQITQNLIVFFKCTNSVVTERKDANLT